MNPMDPCCDKPSSYEPYGPLMWQAGMFQPAVAQGYPPAGQYPQPAHQYPQAGGQYPQQAQQGAPQYPQPGQYAQPGQYPPQGGQYPPAQGGQGPPGGGYAGGYAGGYGAAPPGQQPAGQTASWSNFRGGQMPPGYMGFPSATGGLGMGMHVRTVRLELTPAFRLHVSRATASDLVSEGWAFAPRWRPALHL